MQNEEPSWQCPPEQSFEQHSSFAVQVLPAVWHAVVSAAHLFAVQVPLQHWALELQVWPSETHRLLAHLPLTQLKLQQSVAVLQVAVAAAHA
jgi:hypothetical protein